MQKFVAYSSADVPHSLKQAVASFTPPSDNIEVFSVCHGNINETFIIRADSRSFVLQSINNEVFPEPGKVVSNCIKVSNHIREKLRTARRLRFPLFLTTIDGRNYHRDDSGNVWRAQEYIEDGVVSESIDTRQQAEQVGRCLAEFHYLVEDMDHGELDLPLPGFHDLPMYLQNYDTSVAELGRAATCYDSRYCMQSIAHNRVHADFFQRAVGCGDIALRVVHGDPKVANVIFDKLSGRSITMIDLDTVGPGLLLHDIGDCLRSCCHAGGESDYKGAVFCDTAIVAAVLQGYLEKKSLIDFEAKSIYEALFLLSFELGLRFFTDHLKENIYFKVRYAEENLHRAITQFKLVESIQAQQSVIREIVPHIKKQLNKERKETNE